MLSPDWPQPKLPVVAVAREGGHAKQATVADENELLDERTFVQGVMGGTAEEFGL